MQQYTRTGIGPPSSQVTGGAHEHTTMGGGSTHGCTHAGGSVNGAWRLTLCWAGALGYTAPDRQQVLQTLQPCRKVSRHEAGCYCEFARYSQQGSWADGVVHQLGVEQGNKTQAVHEEKCRQLMGARGKMGGGSVPSCKSAGWRVVLTCGNGPGCRLPLHHTANSAGGGGAGISFSMQATAWGQRHITC